MNRTAASTRYLSLPNLIGIALMLILALSACGKDKKADLEGVHRIRPTATINPETSLIQAPTLENGQGFGAIEGLSDGLAFVQGTSLYFARFDGQEPILIKESIHPPTLNLTQDGNIVYTAIESIRSRYLTITDASTLENRQLFKTSSEFGFLGSISPNGEWAIVSNFPNNVAVKLDGSQSYNLGQFQTQNSTLFWLSDSSLLIIEQAFGDNTAASISLRNFDPAIGENRPLSDENTQALIEAYQNENAGSTGEFTAVLSSSLGLEIATEPIEDSENGFLTIVGPPQAGFGGVPQLCGDWRFERQISGAAPVVVYSFTDTLFLNNASQLDDGSIIFEHWYNLDCDITQRRAALVRLSPDNQLQVLTDRLDVGTSQNFSFFFADTGARSSLSSNQRFVAWIGGGLAEKEATLNIIDLSSNRNYVILRGVMEGANTSGFLDNIAFNAVLWVPNTGN